jgi:uncharacterized protein YegL
MRSTFQADSWKKNMAGGNTNTGEALRVTRTQIFDPSVVRPGVKKIIIMITDGNPQDQGKAIKEADATKEEDIEIFCVGIGKKVSYTLPESTCNYSIFDLRWEK